MTEVIYAKRCGILFSNETEGATDRSECPNRRGTCNCQPKCTVCGWGKHVALHLPQFGGKPGGKPYAHRFIPAD